MRTELPYRNGHITVTSRAVKPGVTTVPTVAIVAHAIELLTLGTDQARALARLLDEAADHAEGGVA